MLKIQLSRLITLAAVLISNAAYAWDYVYADGSANVYQIAPGVLRYVPVKKENSSSGVYTGGVEKSATIDSAGYQSITRLLDAAIEDNAAHTRDRVMASSAISRHTANTKTSVILRPGAAIIRQIEEKLTELLR